MSGALDVGIDNIKEPTMLRLSTSEDYKLRATQASLRLQMNKLGNRPKIATAGLADNSPAVPSWNLAFPITLRAQFPDFQIDDGSSTRTMIKGLILHRCFAFFVSVRLPDGPGYLPAFIVFKFDDELPFRRDDILGHTNRLYNACSKNTRYCGINFLQVCQKEGRDRKPGTLTAAPGGSRVPRESFCLLRQRRHPHRKCSGSRNQRPDRRAGTNYARLHLRLRLVVLSRLRAGLESWFSDWPRMDGHR